MIRSVNVNAAVNRRNITFAIAAILALGTGWLTFIYLTSMSRNSATAAQPRLIVVAQHDIPARAAITPDMVILARRPADAIDTDSIAIPASVIGSITRVSIPAGSAVTASKIGHAFDAGLTARIPDGMRAISIPIDKVKGVANLIQAGDHVDVIALTRGMPGTAPQALTILTNKIVLAMGSTYETTSTTATPSPDAAALSTATLEVTPKDAKLLALADANTTLRLSLRQPKESSGTAGVDSLVLPTVPLPMVGERAMSPAMSRPAVPPSPIRRSAVEVINGDQVAGAR